nr:hypothetical protein BaRGS_007711 [Batillaria attramentaria]
MLRDQQAGFRRNRSCADQIASLRIIVEQSLEWNSPLYINFIDYEKAFDSVDREALWKLLRHYGVPGKIISLIQCTYQDMSCRIAHAGQLSESFEEPVAKQILRRKWGWIGHTLRKRHPAPHAKPDMEPAGEKEERPALATAGGGH